MTAAQRPLQNAGAGADRVYARRGLDHRTAAARRALGVPASVAEAFHGTVAEQSLPWLTTTFSVVGLRALAQRGVSAADVQELRRLAGEDASLSRLRAYVSKTTLRVVQIAWLMDRGVSCGSVVAWQARLPLTARGTDLHAVLSTATVVHGVPDDHVSGWVRYANRFEVPFTPDTRGRWHFLGGETALLAAAGVSPVEATGMTRRGPLDRGGLAVLAALRASEVRGGLR